MSFAHSGGLDANGCHAGSQPYHCHRSADEMVGNRLRCDLGSESIECVSSGNELPPPVPEKPRVSSASRVDPTITVEGKTGCAPNEMSYQNLCISADALATKTTSELAKLIQEFRANNRSGSYQAGDLKICESEIREKDGDIFRLSDGAILDKTSFGYVGYQSYGTNAIYTFSDIGLGYLLLEDEEAIEIEVLKEPRFCDAANTYIVEAASSSKAIINDEVFEFWGLCSDLNEGDSVIFSDSSAAYGMCIFTNVFNLSNNTSCQLSCE